MTDELVYRVSGLFTSLDLCRCQTLIKGLGPILLNLAVPKPVKGKHISKITKEEIVSLNRKGKYV